MHRTNGPAAVKLHTALLPTACAVQAAAARQPGRAYAKLVASGLLADNITEQLAALGIADTGGYVSDTQAGGRGSASDRLGFLSCGFRQQRPDRCPALGCP